MFRHASARRRRPRTRAVALAIALAAIACTQAGANAGGPARGGTLKLLGASDVFNLDTVSAYYTPNNLLERAYTRQLLTYRSLASLPAASALVPDVATRVPTRGNGISADGLVYTFTLRSGVEWSTSPPRQVTADDFVREFKLLCNPASPVSAPGYFTSTIAGMASYCAGFAKVAPTAPAIAAYVDAHALAGVTARDPATLAFRLVKPAPDFLNILATAFASARPVEYMRYVPDSADLRQNTISDGPYRITSYVPTKSFTLERNPAWQQASDPFRHDYVDAIQVTEGLTSQSVQQQLEAGTADMEWDLPPPPQDLHRLIAAHDKRLIIAPPGRYYAAFPYYLVLNHYKGPMTNRLVRRAVAAAVDKQTIVQIAGGPRIGAVADQMVLPGSVGYLASLARSRVNGGAGDPGAAKALLARAGYAHGLAIKLLESTTEPGPRVAQALQASLNRGGFKVTLVRATQADYYGRYLLQPGTAKRDLWDLALPGWIPDWFGSNGRTMLQPLFTQAGLGSTNFGGYDDALTNRLVDSALKARTPATAATLWERANERLAHEVAAVPLVVVKSTIYLSSRVHGCNWFFWDASCDVTNIWLS